MAVLVVPLLMMSWSLGSVLSAPGTDPVVARLAEWGRNHGMSSVVTTLENWQYQLSPPKIGGAPSKALLTAGLTRTGTTATAPKGAVRSGVVPLHAPLTPVVTPGLSGEGVFRPVVTVKGQPVVQVTYLRPDASHTSYLAGVAWMDARALRFVQHPGFLEPGHLSLWNQPDSLPPALRAGLAATFNSGFKLVDAHGGYYQNGHTVGTLRTGAASMVFYSNGSINIGSWGQDVSMTPQVTGVRQNLSLLIDKGQMVPSIDTNVQVNWGVTIKGAYYVWRSGIGITKNGNIVFVMGNAMSVRSLATVLLHAGAVRAMELDINPDWVSYMWYSPGSSPANPSPVKILPFARPADRYLVPSSRDFVAVYAR